MSVGWSPDKKFAVVPLTVGHALLTVAEMRARLGAVTAQAGEPLALDVMTPDGPLRMSVVWGGEGDAAIWRLEACGVAALLWLAGAMGDVGAFVEWAVDDPAKASLDGLVGAYHHHIALRKARTSDERDELPQLMVELGQVTAPGTDDTPWPPLQQLPTGGWFEPRFRGPKWALAAGRRLRAGVAPEWPARPTAALADPAATVQWLAWGRGLRHAWLRRAHPRRDLRLYGEYVAVLRALARVASRVSAGPSGGLTVVRRAWSATAEATEPFGDGWAEQPDLATATLAYGNFLLGRLGAPETRDDLRQVYYALASEVFDQLTVQAVPGVLRISVERLRHRLVRVVAVRTRYADMFAAGADPAAAELLASHAETLRAIVERG